MSITVFNYNNTAVRTEIIESAVWFCGKDVCDVLGYANNSKAIKDHCRQDGVTIRYLTDGLGRQQAASFINEPNLYRLIMRSKMQAAEAFENWVVSEVLPTIRKTGGYITPDKLAQIYTNPDELPDFIIKVGEALKEARAKVSQLEEEKKLNAPKVLFAESVAGSKNSILVGDLAKILKQRGINIGQNRLFSWMRENGYLGKTGERWNKPNQRFMDSGLFELKETVVQNADGEPIARLTVKVTGKGQEYFINKFLSKAEARS